MSSTCFEMHFKKLKMRIDDERARWIHTCKSKHHRTFIVESGREIYGCSLYSPSNSSECFKVLIRRLQGTIPAVILLLNLRSRLLSERSQTPKRTYAWLRLYGF